MPGRFAVVMLALAWLPVPALPNKAHVHGVATLEAAVDGSRLVLALDIPLEDLVGFERAPKTDKERAAVQAAVAYFASGKAFVPNAEAGCRLAESKPELPTAGEHASLRALSTFECANAAALRSVTVALFDAFPKVRRIDAQVAGAKKQSGARLTAKGRQLPL
jgi:hypothetical protein